MLRAALSMLILASPVNDLVSQQFRSIKLNVPAVWKHTLDKQETQPGEEAPPPTDRFRSPSSDAEILIDTGKTMSPMEAKVCVQKITTASGGDWTGVSISAQPAARQVTEDRGDNGVEVETIRYIGCNGKTTWSVEFRVDAKKKDRYQALVDQVIQSLKYL